MKITPFEVLLVEDDSGDVELTREAFKDSKLTINLNVVKDGVEAIAYLRNQGAYSHVERPDLILLDLNLPRMDGREVLRLIKNDSSIKTIPIIVLSTSCFDSDVSLSYELGANSYVTKPIGMSELMRVISTIQDFWFTIVKLPPKHLEC